MSLRQSTLVMIVMIPVLLATLLSGSAHADVLFLDLNNSPKEIEAARRGAERRGERLVVVPAIAPELQDRVRASRRLSASAYQEKRKVCASESEDSPLCQQATAKLKQQQRNHSVLVKQLPKLDARKLSAEMAKLKGENVNLTSVVISGHDGDREFWGTLADLDEEDIENALLANKPLGDNVRSMYLWGCYAATTDDFIKSWKKAFPPTLMIAGFNAQAPLGSRPASGSLLEDILVKEQELGATRDKVELKRIFDSLSDVNKVHFNVCVDRELIVSKSGVRTIQDDIQACGQHSDREDRHLKVFNCYLKAEDGCEDVPRETDGGSPLRKVYDFLQETRHCEDVLTEAGRARPVSQLLARRLLFDKTVRKNFEKHHKAELKELNRLMEELDMPKNAFAQGFDRLSRREYLELLRNMERAWLERMDSLKDDDGRVHDPRVLAVGRYIGEIQKLEKAGCVPLSWVEEEDGLRDSKCGIKQGMRDALRKSEDEVKRYSQAEKN